MQYNIYKPSIYKTSHFAKYVAVLILIDLVTVCRERVRCETLSVRISFSFFRFCEFFFFIGVFLSTRPICMYSFRRISDFLLCHRLRHCVLGKFVSLCVLLM